MLLKMHKKEQEFAVKHNEPDQIISNSITNYNKGKNNQRQGKLPPIISPGHESEKNTASIDDHDSEIGTNLAAKMDTEGNTL